MIDLEARMIRDQDAVLLGRGRCDEWLRSWPTSGEQPVADFINGVTKYVITSRPLTTIWGDAEAVAGPVDAFLGELKTRPGGDIGVHGSVELARSLLAARLVDELQLAVGPVLDPVGRRLFDRVADRTLLHLRDATTTPSGTVWLTYRIAA